MKKTLLPLLFGVICLSTLSVKAQTNQSTTNVRHQKVELKPKTAKFSEAELLKLKAEKETDYNNIKNKRISNSGIYKGDPVLANIEKKEIVRREVDKNILRVEKTTGKRYVRLQPLQKAVPQLPKK